MLDVKKTYREGRSKVSRIWDLYRDWLYRRKMEEKFWMVNIGLCSEKFILKEFAGQIFDHIFGWGRWEEDVGGIEDL